MGSKQDSTIEHAYVQKDLEVETCRPIGGSNADDPTECMISN
jgi:hypothetical protein